MQALARPLPPTPLLLPTLSYSLKPRAGARGASRAPAALQFQLRPASPPCIKFDRPLPPFTTADGSDDEDEDDEDGDADENGAESTPFPR